MMVICVVIQKSFVLQISWFVKMTSVDHGDTSSLYQTFVTGDNTGAQMEDRDIAQSLGIILLKVSDLKINMLRIS